MTPVQGLLRVYTCSSYNETHRSVKTQEVRGQASTVTWILQYEILVVWGLTTRIWLLES